MNKNIFELIMLITIALNALLSVITMFIIMIVSLSGEDVSDIIGAHCLILLNMFSYIILIMVARKTLFNNDKNEKDDE